MNTYTTLDMLKTGQNAVIQGINPNCPPTEKYRLFDFGFVKGEKVSIYLESPFKNPTAFLICSSAIALREYQSKYINIQLLPNE